MRTLGMTIVGTLMLGTIMLMGLAAVLILRPVVSAEGINAGVAATDWASIGHSAGSTAMTFWLAPLTVVMWGVHHF